ncbi:MAG: phosphoesterase, partial [Acidobacteria bacterium]|nr:phosphoesterase [Acidobacteriota bacterium]
MKRIKVCYHGNCFDGVSSAAVFSRFYSERIVNGQGDWEYNYQPMMHRAGVLFDEGAFDGNENAIVDFKYSSSPKLTWWFDHHKSAFLSPQDEVHFKADTSGKKFLDPAYKSCTKLIADVAQRNFGFDSAPMGELIHWANVIDGALYKSAAEPVEMKADALKLALVIESDRDQKLIEQIINDLKIKTLSEVARSPYVVERIDPLYLQHLNAIEILARAEAEHRALEE